jgi:hypothetical protein
MSTLRELTAELAGINELAKDPEIPAEAIANTINGLEGMFKDKAINVVHVLLNNDSDIGEIDAEIKRLNDRKKVMNNAKERLKDYLRFNMEASGISKIESPLFTITLAKAREVVVVDDTEKLPEDYKRVTVSPDKALIGKALKDGYEVPGASLALGQSSIRIK